MPSIAWYAGTAIRSGAPKTSAISGATGSNTRPMSNKTERPKSGAIVEAECRIL
jgi:hypothetical protein